MYDRGNCKRTNEDIHVHVPLEMRRELSQEERAEQLQQDREWLVQMYTVQQPIDRTATVLIPLAGQSDMLMDASSSFSTPPATSPTTSSS